jgi:hypothetical protein
MARGIRWAHERNVSESGNFLIVNTGSGEWNYQVKELAEAIKETLPQTKVSINKDAQPDKRSYRVDFSLFKSLAPDHQPVYDLKTTIGELIDGLKSINFTNKDFRNSDLIRLYVINDLKAKSLIDNELRVVQPRLVEQTVVG